MTQNKSNKLIAICGGIASGKSLVCNILRDKGCRVISCDDINRDMLADPDYINIIADSFHNIVIDGVINKKALRELIINDSAAKSKLESIAHPRIRNKILEVANSCDSDLYVEVPLLNSSGIANIFHDIWFVLAPHDRRIELLMARDNLSRESAELIISLQSLEDELSQSARCIIVNDGTYNQLCARVNSVYYST